ncbi:hypothetical protein [Geothrix rubra]|uniref:hypothetical protein n=1 Tax=Geothrix rubra TaxID=2927977 RepID=UPI0025567768|nr:hypothetical protein [Geothrix rubra]
MRLPILVGFLALLASLAIAGAPGEAIRVETLQKSEETSGCGTAYFLGHEHRSGQAEVFAVLTETDEAGCPLAVIRVNGEAHRLTQIKRQDFPKRAKGSRLGDHFIEIWRGTSIQVQFECTITETLYEETDFKGKMIVKIGPNKRVVLVRGFTGC